MINYSLALRTTWSADDVDALVQDALASRRGAGDHALTGRALPVADPSGHATLDEMLGAHTDVEVHLDLDAKADAYEHGRLDLAVVSAAVATRAAKSACLVMEYEQVLMRFADGRLTLHDWYPEWRDPEVIATLTVPYELTSDPGRY